MTDRREHWDRVYSTRAPDEVSWFQPIPDRSLRLIHAAAPVKTIPIIDIGGGVSTLTGELLRSGYTDLTVLDISSEALERARKALGAASATVTWITADITHWQPPRQWMVWHDRAVFHFLTECAQQDAYIGALHAATAVGATVIVSTFPSTVRSDAVACPCSATAPQHSPNASARPSYWSTRTWRRT